VSNQTEIVGEGKGCLPIFIHTDKILEPVRVDRGNHLRRLGQMRIDSCSRLPDCAINREQDYEKQDAGAPALSAPL